MAAAPRCLTHTRVEFAWRRVSTVLGYWRLEASSEDSGVCTGFYTRDSCGTEGNPDLWALSNGQNNLANHADSNIDYVDFHLWPGMSCIVFNSTLTLQGSQILRGVVNVLADTAEIRLRRDVYIRPRSLEGSRLRRLHTRLRRDVCILHIYLLQQLQLDLYTRSCARAKQHAGAFTSAAWQPALTLRSIQITAYPIHAATRPGNVQCLGSQLAAPSESTWVARVV